MPFAGKLEIARLLESFNGSEYRDVVFTAAFTGLRRSEVLALTWSDIDLELMILQVNRTVHKLKSGEYITKSPKSRRGRRSVDLPLQLCHVLRERKAAQQATRQKLGIELKETDLVFSNLDGTPIRPDTITRVFSKKAKELGLNLTFHGLRHSHASLMLAANVHPRIVSERLGYSTTNITLDLYSHVVPTLQAQAASKFDEIIGPIEAEQKVH